MTLSSLGFEVLVLVHFTDISHKFGEDFPKHLNSLVSTEVCPGQSSGLPWADLYLISLAYVANQVKLVEFGLKI